MEETKRHGFDPWVGKIPWRRAWQPTPGRTNFVNDDAVSRFLQIVEAMGVVKALREEGCKDGDTVRIKDVEFDFMD